MWKQMYMICFASAKYMNNVGEENRSYSQWEECSGVKEQLLPWCMSLILHMQLPQLQQLL